MKTRPGSISGMFDTNITAPHLIPSDAAIRYQCQCCGDCCRRKLSIELSLAEMEFLRKSHQEVNIVYAYAKGELVRPFFNTGTECKLLDGDLCSIYDQRPFECRYFPFHLVEVDPSTPHAMKYGKKYYQLYIYNNCKGVGKGESWSSKKKRRFINRILREYAEHEMRMMKTKETLTTDEFFKDHKQYGPGVVYGTEKELEAFIKDYNLKLNINNKTNKKLRPESIH